MKTIETHRANIKRKLQMKDTTQLLHYTISWLGSLATLNDAGADEQ